MREIKIGNKEIRVRATPLALLYYRQEFNRDLLADFVISQEWLDDPAKIDSLKLLQITWAMNKADNLGKQFPSFEKWLSEFEYCDFTDESFVSGMMEEAQAGFFRGIGEEVKK